MRAPGTVNKHIFILIIDLLMRYKHACDCATHHCTRMFSQSRADLFVLILCADLSHFYPTTDFLFA